MDALYESDSDDEVEVNDVEFICPVIGDHVVSHHRKWAFYYATIADYDKEKMEYTVDWDDKDPSGKTESYEYSAF